MQIEDEGILVDKIKYGETSMILSIFTRNYGLQKGILKGAVNIKKKSSLEIGNILNIVKRSKTENNLGFFKVELKKSYLSSILFSKDKLLILSALCEFIKSLLPEKQEDMEFYDISKSLIILLDSKDYLMHYLKWELLLLDKIGYGLDFSKCVKSGKEDIYYLSPRSGKSVCKEIGDPYKDKLFIIPNFLKGQEIENKLQEALLGFKITSFFLNKFMQEYNKIIPFTREILIQKIYLQKV